jgi:hypothetical protein
MLSREACGSPVLFSHISVQATTNQSAQIVEYSYIPILFASVIISILSMLCVHLQEAVAKATEAAVWEQRLVIERHEFSANG